MSERKPRNLLENGDVPESVREVIRPMILDGIKQDKIKAEVMRLCGVRIHNSTLKAYRTNAEYKEWVAMRRGWDYRLQKRRWAASIVNDGKGAKSLMDMAAIELLEQIYELSEEKKLDPEQKMKVLAEITKQQRVQVLRERDNWQRRIAELQAEIDQAEFAARQDERRKMAEAKIVADAKAEQIGKKAGITPAVIAQIKAIYGIKDAPTEVPAVPERPGADTGAPR